MNSETLCSLPSCSPFRFLTFKAHKRWERLDDFLLHSLNNYEKSPNGYSKLQIKKWIEQPRVFIHQKRVKRNSKIINRDTSVDFLYPETALKTLSDKIPILFEDEHYIAINKPSGLASQSTKNPEDPHCLNLVKFYLNPQPELLLNYAGLIHRLDQPTSGVIVYAKSKQANQILSRQFSHQRTKKEYLALSDRWESPNSVEVKAKLLRTKQGKGYVSKVDAKNGQDSHTSFELLGQKEGLYFIKAHPKTGRTHQIRAHLSYLGSPLLGDSLYGGTAHEDFALHAYKLSFYHFAQKKVVHIEAPLPESFLKFENLLK